MINNNLVLVPGFQICIVLEQDGKVRSLHLTSYEEMLVAWRRQSLPDGVYECMEVQFQPGSTITPCFSPALSLSLGPLEVVSSAHQFRPALITIIVC